MPAPPGQAAQLEAALRRALDLHRAGRAAEAEQSYRALLDALPGHPEISNLLGRALRDQGRIAEAVAVFERALAVTPSYAAAHCNLGHILFEQGKRVEAEASFRRALELDPDSPDALKNLGTVLVDGGRFAESFPWFRRHAELTYGRPPASPEGSEPMARHAREQQDHLGGGGWHLEEGERVAGRAVNLDPSGEVAARWKTASPQVVIVDNLLTEEALAGLRRYSWRSTVWQRAYPRGYLGAMPEHGFAFPLLAQIADELRGVYPEIVGDHPLLHWWGFKYDSRHEGIDVHADFAALNVNLWITPDDANLDPQSGGMVVWDVPAPPEWSVPEYNAAGSCARIRELLARRGARSLTVPYRCNRAVLFDSDLFHETDRVVFAEGYLQRRINITLLYGRRGAGKTTS